MSAGTAFRRSGQAVVMAGLLVGLLATASPGVLSAQAKDDATQAVRVQWGLEGDDWESRNAIGEAIGSPASNQDASITPNTGAIDFAGGGQPLGGGLGMAGDTASSIPYVARRAYQNAETLTNQADPTCKLDWQLIAGIGKVESNHGQIGNRVPAADGRIQPPIIGVPLNGSPGVALIKDTDKGALDGDREFDRAVGPMQFIPATWALYKRDGNGDKEMDPHNMFDAALATATFLCAGPADMTNATSRREAVLRYNNSGDYANKVLSYASGYATPTASAPGAGGGLGSPGGGFGTPGGGTPGLGAPGGAPPLGGGFTPNPKPAQPGPGQPGLGQLKPGQPKPEPAQPQPQPARPNPQPEPVKPNPGKVDPPQPQNPNPVIVPGGPKPDPIFPASTTDQQTGWLW